MKIGHQNSIVLILLAVIAFLSFVATDLLSEFVQQNERDETTLGGSFINDFTIVTQSTAVTVGPSTSVTLAEANVARQYLILSNNGSADVYLRFSGSSATANSGILMTASSTYEIDQDALYTGAIQAISSATTTVLVTEK